MRVLILLGPALAFGIVGCASSTFPKAHVNGQTHVNDHWNMRSIGPRMGRAFLGYDRDKDGDYDDFQWGKKQDINLTIRRHFFNQNPENPFEPPPDDYYKGLQKPKNTLTRPVSYIHLEGLAMGAILYGAGAAFIPIPIDSILGSFESRDKPKEPRVATTSSMYEDLPKK